MVYKLVAKGTPSENVADMGGIDTDILYDKLMNRCNWDNLTDPSVYFDWHHRRMFGVMNIRAAFYRLADALIGNGELVLAKKVLDRSSEILPFRLWPVDYWSCEGIALYFQIGETDAGMQRLQEQRHLLEQWLDYFEQFNLDLKATIAEERTAKLYYYRQLLLLVQQIDLEARQDMETKFTAYLDAISPEN